MPRQPTGRPTGRPISPRNLSRRAATFQNRAAARAWMNQMDAAMRPFGAEYHGMNVGATLGSPFRRNLIRGAGYATNRRQMAGAIIGGVKIRRRVGTVRFTGYFDRVYQEVNALFEDVMIRVVEKAQAYAESISPVDTGSYREMIRVTLTVAEKAAGSRAGVTRNLRIYCFVEPGVAPSGRIPSDYAFFVEYGGQHTPPYQIMHRTVDWALREAYRQFQAFSGGRAFR